MRPLNQFPNIEPPDGDFPFGRAKNNTGANDGTRVNEHTMQDIWNLMAKIMQESGITPNNLPDNEYTGQQLWDALIAVTEPTYTYLAQISQSGSSAPTDAVVRNTIKGSITWARSSAGVYTATYTGSIASIFSIPHVPLIGSVDDSGVSIEFTSSTVLTVRTRNNSGALADGILSGTGVAIYVQK